jgi:NAD(P)-dependent dehydrogenase (short-subunit alcohol dehydrogenase family)
VAVVTGAGRGLGRAYALLLAERGAAVVVNDLGGTVTGEGRDTGPAQQVTAEITSAGGAAVANTGDISTEGGAQEVVQACLDAFGRLDVLIANAGIMRWARFPDVTAEDLEVHLAVHVGGAFHTARAAWPHLAETGSGRIVLTTSTGMLGMPANTAYATAKAGVIGLARSLATAGARHGIAVNCIAPAASTRMAGDDAPDMPPELVAPMVAFLAHDRCPTSGEVYTAGAGRFGRLFIGATPGWVPGGSNPGDGVPTVEDVAAGWSAINDETGYSVPASLADWAADFLGH